MVLILGCRLQFACKILAKIFLQRLSGTGAIHGKRFVCREVPGMDFIAASSRLRKTGSYC
jgi:hypothetical protein